MEPTPSPRSAWADLAREHPGLLLSAAYLVLTFVGLSYELWFFWYFRINILEFVETSDFLLAALRTPLVIVLAVLPLLLVWLYFRLDRWLRRRFPGFERWQRRWEGKPYNSPAVNRVVWTIFVLIYAFVFIQMYAQRVTDRIKAGHGREVHVELVSGAPLPSRALLLGTSAKFVFVYLPAEKRTHILPIENVSRLVISSEKTRR
jgi:hypothetical protein